ncbi:MAG: hypothetical protein A2270_06845 [Elusimicrobia bacterium RIFOXYA12_FULL_51_18]|nr:MAG: hypothetical protein A2270_06845 [Elusimicrobia bacterium RIFOXYA12_FULL_51_18]OGS28403.1 MAG: hypothetical protein A2218_05150 [Elusimicrobia bacterium RIFOXYA2_FULL_53_38]
MRKIFAFLLSLIVLCFGVDAFLGNACAQNQKATSPKSTKQSQVKTGRIITVGEHGQLKGFDGFQMALNMAQDMDEIKIEKGIINGSGFTIAANKVWEHGIKISGGWDEAFSKNSNNPEDTTLDGGSGDGQGPIFTISKKVIIENLAFKNGAGGAIVGNATFTNCIFTNNSAYYGGAVRGDGAFYNCIFTNNSSDHGGGAVRGDGAFYNCTFANNSIKYNSDVGGGGAVNGNGNFYNCIFTNNWTTSANGGAVSSNGNFYNCIFTNNSARFGGAAYGSAAFINCTFYGNQAAGAGGAVVGGKKIFNSIFYKNTAAKKGNDITVDGSLKIDFSLFNYVNGGADIGTSIVMGDPKFIDPDNGDLHLLSDSPCVGKGKQLSGLKDAKDINIKQGLTGKGINMGADEAVLTSALKDYARILEVSRAAQIITDNRSGLMWVKDGSSIGCNSGERLIWPEAVAFCEGLTYLGYFGWRLPSKQELEDFFHDNGRGLFMREIYWSGTTKDESADSAWRVDFGVGDVSFNSTTNDYNVCCVRTINPVKPVALETQKSVDDTSVKDNTVAAQDTEPTGNSDGVQKAAPKAPQTSQEATPTGTSDVIPVDSTSTSVEVSTVQVTVP